MSFSENAQPANGWKELFSGSNGLKILALTGGVGLHAVNVFISGTLLPSVVADIGGLDLFAWNTTLFIVASILAAAFAATRPFSIGARGCYGLASAAFALGSLLCALAPSMPVMLVGRFVQGFGAGLLVALSYAMIRIVFPERLWPRAIGLISAVWGVATLLGPAIGGIFAQYGAWRLSFWVLVPLALLLGWLTVSVLPSGKHEEAQAKVPLPQIVLIVIAIFLISIGSTLVSDNWPLASGMLVAAIMSIFVLVMFELRSEARLLPSGSFSGTTLSAIYAAMVLMQVGMSSDIFIPLFLQVLHGQTPLAAGYLSALISAGWTAGSMLSSGWQEKGARRAILAGPIMMTLAMLALWLILGTDNREGNWSILAAALPALFVMGFAIGLGWPHLLSGVMRHAPAGEEDRACASISMVQLLATAFGAALAGMAVNLAGLTHPGGVDGAIGAARWLFLLFAFAPGLAIFAALMDVRKSARATNREAVYQ